MENIHECPICFDTFTTSLKPLISQCGHTYCERCTRDIISKNPICPFCSKPIQRELSNYIINFALIREKKDYSKSIEKLQQEIAFLNEHEKILKDVNESLYEAITKTENDIKSSIDSLIKILNDLKPILRKELDQIRSVNKEKILKHKKDAAGLLEARNRLLFSLENFQKTGENLDQITLIELNSLKDLGGFEVSLKKTNFNIQLNLISSSLTDAFTKGLSVENQSFLFENEGEGHRQNSDMARIHNPCEINGKAIENDRRNQPNKNFNLPGEKIRIKPIGKNNEMGDARFRNNEIQPEGRGNRTVNLPAKFDWFIIERNREIKLPDFASGQIERCRTQGILQIKIYRKGRVMCIADLENMEYSQLDFNGNIAPGQTFRLVKKQVF